MSPVDFTDILDPDFPPVDRSQITPSVQMVALLMRTRTVDVSGTEQGTFTDTTRPSENECEGVIAQAMELCLADMPDFLPESIYPRVQQAIAIRTAVLIELSFFREQAQKDGTAKSFETMYEKLLASIEIVSGGSTSGKRVDSIVQRSTMAEYEPDYPIPPPRIMIRQPIPFDGDPDSEGQVDN